MTKSATLMTVCIFGICSTLACSGNDTEGNNSQDGTDNISYPENPATRLVSLDVPEGPLAARNAGCAVLGGYVGSGLGSLAILSGGLDQHFKPNSRGEVSMVLAAEAKSFSPDSPFDMNFLMGSQTQSQEFSRQAPAESLIDPAEIDARFSDIVLDEDGWFDAVTAKLVLPIPILEDFMVAVGINAATLSGQLDVQESGMAFEGLLMGYLPNTEVMRLTIALIDACGWEDTPIICDITAGQITATTPPEDAYDIIVGFMGHYDVRIENGIPVECDLDAAEDAEDGCNALGVCLEVGMEAVELLD